MQEDKLSESAKVLQDATEVKFVYYIQIRNK